MESIVKMGVSGKNTYGKNEQRDGAAGADPYSAQEAGLYQDLNGADAGESKSAVSAAASSAAAAQEKQKLEKQKAEQKKAEERKRLAAE